MVRCSLAILLLVGCPKEEAHEFPDLMAHAEENKDEMCACKDAACAARVDLRVAALAKEPQPPPWTDEDAKKMIEIVGKMDRCRAKAIATPSPKQ